MIDDDRAVQDLRHVLAHVSQVLNNRVRLESRGVASDLWVVLECWVPDRVGGHESVRRRASREVLERLMEFCGPDHPPGVRGIAGGLLRFFSGSTLEEAAAGLPAGPGWLSLVAHRVIEEGADALPTMKFRGRIREWFDAT